MVNILNSTNSIANQFLFEMRDKDIQNDRGKFRNNLKRLGICIAFEISKKLEYKTQHVDTPLGTASVDILKRQPVIISILRAAIPLHEGFLEVFDQSKSGFIGAYRMEENDISVKLDYMGIPDINGQDLIVVDPMLATGKSMLQTIENVLKEAKPKSVHIACAVAAPEGIDYISKSLGNDVTIWVAAMDERLNSSAYIVPGLGDAGDLSFGKKN